MRKVYITQNDNRIWYHVLISDVELFTFQSKFKNKLEKEKGLSENLALCKEQPRTETVLKQNFCLL